MTLVYPKGKEEECGRIEVRDGSEGKGVKLNIFLIWDGKERIAGAGAAGEQRRRG